MRDARLAVESGETTPASESSGAIPGPLAGLDADEPARAEVEALLAVRAKLEDVAFEPRRGLYIYPSEVDPSWVKVTGFTTDEEAWAAWVEDGKVRGLGLAEGSEEGPPASPCDIKYPESAC